MSDNKYSNFYSILFLILGIAVVVLVGWAVIHNTIKLQQDCKDINGTLLQSYNDTECGCKWYNLCDNGCIVCRLDGNHTGDINPANIAN